MKKYLFLLAGLLTGIVSLPAQQKLAHTDIILFALNKSADSLWHPAAPRYLTAFNPAGYNNQPSFVSPSEIYLTVQKPTDTTQTDIYSLNLANMNLVQVMATGATSEYSPTLMPGGKRFSAVRVEEDGNQRLWSFPIDRSDEGRPEFSKIYNVGYHCWLRDTLAALFIVGEGDQPHTLKIAGLKGQKSTRIASGIGRCLLTTPDGRLLFVQKATDETWFLKVYDVKKNTQDIVVKMPAGTEDFALLADGTYLCGSGALLYQFKPGRNTDWVEVGNLSKYGVKKISRLCVSKDNKLAIVVTPP